MLRSHSLRVTALLTAACLAAALCCPPHPLFAQDSPPERAFRVTKDGTFDSTEGPWELRYAQKLSDEGRTRPQWRAVVETDSKDPTRGRHLYLKPFGPAAGSVYVGQRFRVPDPVPIVDLTLDYQTFCEAENRSGALDLLLVAPDAWDALPDTPQDAGKPLEDALLRLSVHGNRDDVTTWTAFVASRERLLSALRGLAGKEIVLAFAWETWHSGALEWARFDNFGLADPPPSVEPMNWPKYAYAGEALTLAVAATGQDIEAVAVEHRAQSDAEDAWQVLVAKKRHPGLWSAEIPVSAMDKPRVVRARALRASGAVMMCEPHRIFLTRRPQHPCIAYNAEEIARMRERIDQYDWAAGAWERIRKAADERMAENLQPPTEPGGWSHDYTCAHCGAPLVYRDDHPHEHLCRKCGKITRGEKPDATWRCFRHCKVIDAAYNMGLVWQITGEERYAREAIRILKWYADHYADFPPQPRRGKVHWQSLTESSWLARVTEAADLVFDAMTDDEKRAVEANLVRAGAEHVAAQPCGYSNWRCWYNACLGLAGYFLNDPDLISRARDGEGGFKYMIDQGVLEDGMWYERSVGYHRYSLYALVKHTQADRHAGGELWRYGRFPKMFTAELRIAFPDLTPPSLNDMGYVSTKIGTYFPTYAWAWYKDSLAAGALNQLYAEGARRDRLENWHIGEPIPSDLRYEQPASQPMPGVGMAVLRQGKGDDALCAMLEYGEHGGGHGHPDKLQLIFFGLGEQLCPDLGTVRYGHPLYRHWYKTTPAHNTVTIGGRSMKPETGELVDFRDAGHYSSAVAQANSVYSDWRLQRRILLHTDFLVDVFDLEGNTEQTIDWFLRAPGRLDTGMPLAGLDEKPPTRPYEQLGDLRGAMVDAPWRAAWTLDAKLAPPGGGRLLVDFAGAPGTQAAIARAPGPPGETWDTLRVRRIAEATRFTVVYRPLREGAQAAAARFGADTIQVGDARVRVPDGAGLLEMLSP